MIGNRYWSTGINLKYTPYSNQWCATLKFFDSGFCQDESTEGKLYTRYYIDDPVQAIKTLIEDAVKLGIEFNLSDGKIILMWSKAERTNRPKDWKSILEDIAKKTGTKSAYQELEVIKNEY